MCSSNYIILIHYLYFLSLKLSHNFHKIVHACFCLPWKEIIFWLELDLALKSNPNSKKREALSFSPLNYLLDRFYLTREAGEGRREKARRGWRPVLSQAHSQCVARDMKTYYSPSHRCSRTKKSLERSRLRHDKAVHSFCVMLDLNNLEENTHELFFDYFV